MPSTSKPRALRNTTIIDLPPPKLRSRFSVERALFVRRSVREFSREPISLNELAQLLWSAQGITSKEGFRTTPSAGAVFPLEIYAVVTRVEGLSAGVYHYVPGPGFHAHHVRPVKRGRFGTQLHALSTQQDFIKQVAVNLVLGTVTSRMEKQYGEAALRYVLMEMGHAAQNIHLQAESLGLGSVAVGYLQEKTVRELLGMEADPLYFVSVGRKREQK
jgi:SagB-type dehydrogenase family enzyme